ARWFASLGRRLLSSARPAFAPSPHRCLRSVALPVDPSFRKPVINLIFSFCHFFVFRSFKFRFRTMKDGQIRRWRAGKRHNAHSKVTCYYLIH
ncbi:hypothetical protein B296_00044042, partial [Ensete ventricosum]